VDADLLFTRGIVYTMDPRRPRAEALAVAGDRILAVGATAEIQAYKGSRTRVIDLRGRALLPGFYDAHQHQLYRGLSFKQVDGRADSIPALIGRVRERASQLQAGSWIEVRATTTAGLPNTGTQQGKTSTLRLRITRCS